VVMACLLAGALTISQGQDEATIVRRLNTQKRTSFSSAVELFDLIERTAIGLTEREAAARFALYRLRAMKAVLMEVPRFQGESEPYSSWIRAHADASMYNEPAGFWQVSPSHVMSVHEIYADTSAADDIAWFRASNGLPGDCEGDVVCYVDWQNNLNGWYLRAHPRGKHANESGGDIALKLNAAMDNLRDYPDVLHEFDPNRECGSLHESLDPLANALRASDSSRKNAALRALARFGALCK
jgi:hypothetical protein